MSSAATEDTSSDATDDMRRRAIPCNYPSAALTKMIRIVLFFVVLSSLVRAVFCGYLWLPMEARDNMSRSFLEAVRLGNLKGILKPSH